MINREDMLELTRRMTPARSCFDRIAGAYINDLGEVDESFNIHFGKLSASEKARNLELAKTVPFSKTNIQLKEYTFSDTVKGKDSMWQLLQAIQQCGLKNDALMEILYEQIADGYPVDNEFAVFVFHGVYDVPLKGKDKESLWESEEVYNFIICTVSPMRAAYEPAEPVFGFLYPAFSDRSADAEKIDIFHADANQIEEGLMYKLLGKL
ncbi:MAG: DUF4317 family protein [Lachnospiraceae bacterium]|nr:DUF4317 family protein [Lachnospiraceae bacterium]